jgi:hypothetical protein
MTTHVAVRPSWQCTECGQAWPCRAGRRQLLTEHADSQISLALYLSSCLVEAAQDLPQQAANDLYSRFVGWLRSPP